MGQHRPAARRRGSSRSRRRTAASARHARARPARSTPAGAGATPTPLPLADVTRITPIGASFWAKLEGSVDAGFSYTRSSGVAQVNLNGDVRYRRPAFLVHLTGSATVTEAGRRRRDRTTARRRSSRMRATAAAAGSSPAPRGSKATRASARTAIADRRLLGRRLISTNRAQVEIGGGHCRQRRTGRRHRGDAEPRRAADRSRRRTSPTTGRRRTSTARLQYYPSLSTWGRQRVQLDTSFKRELYKDLYASVNLLLHVRQRAAESQRRARSDLGVTFSLGWSF